MDASESIRHITLFHKKTRPKQDLPPVGLLRKSILPLPKKVQAIQNLAVPKSKILRNFICITNYYRDMWARRSECLAPLHFLTSKNIQLKCNSEYE